MEYKTLDSASQLLKTSWWQWNSTPCNQISHCCLCKRFPQTWLKSVKYFTAHSRNKNSSSLPVVKLLLLAFLGILSECVDFKLGQEVFGFGCFLLLFGELVFFGFIWEDEFSLQIVTSTSFHFIQGTYPVKCMLVIFSLYLLNRLILVLPGSAIKIPHTCAHNVFFSSAFPLFRWAGFHQLTLKRTNELKAFLCWAAVSGIV